MKIEIISNNNQIRVIREIRGFTHADFKDSTDISVSFPLRGAGGLFNRLPESLHDILLGDNGYDHLSIRSIIGSLAGKEVVNQ